MFAVQACGQARALGTWWDAKQVSAEHNKHCLYEHYKHCTIFINQHVCLLCRPVAGPGHLVAQGPVRWQHIAELQVGVCGVMSKHGCSCTIPAPLHDGAPPISHDFPTFCYIALFCYILFCSATIIIIIIYFLFIDRKAQDGRTALLSYEKCVLRGYSIGCNACCAAICVLAHKFGCVHILLSSALGLVCLSHSLKFKP